MDTQKAFFETVKKNLSSGMLLAGEVSDVLNISSDSAYRRIRGEKELTVNELSKLCRHFNISMDEVINYRSGNILFRYTPLDMSSMDNYYAYLQKLAALMESIAKAGEKEMCFMAVDIPGPHFKPFPELMLFKIYTWFQGVNKLHVTYDRFVEQLDIPLITDVYNRIGNAYSQIPSTEIWTVNTIDHILHLLDYYPDLNCFEHTDTFSLLCSQLLQLIENMEKLAEKEKKEYKGKEVIFRMYLSPLEIMNDFMIIKKDGACVTAVKLYTINGIFTSNEYFCSEVEKWMKNSIAKSVSLSGNSARERFQFFQNLKNKVNGLTATKE